MTRTRSVRSMARLMGAALLLTTLSLAGAQADPAGAIPVIPPGSAYRQVNLASDVPGLAMIQDPLLVNSWGLAVGPTGPLNVANNGTSTLARYDATADGSLTTRATTTPLVTVPGSLPTGSVNNPTTDFVIGAGPSAPASVLTASITGNIVGWQAGVPVAGSSSGTTAASHPGHVYTGLALANNGAGNFLYAADFANGTIDVFNAAFALQPAVSFPFVDPTIPTTSGNTYHPYNVQAIGGSLYVAYAKVGTGGLPEDGVGNGFVRRFNANGVRDLTFGINNGALNSPWGTTIAPATYGIFGGALLIGNEGEGNPSIHAFNPTTGAFLGTLQNDAGEGIVIEDLHALAFGNGTGGGAVGTLYFTAGVGDQQHGLLGSLTPTSATAASLVSFSTDDYLTSEGSGSIEVTVTRSGDVSGPATIQYAAWDRSVPAHASQKNDYQIATGVLTFPAGRTSRTFTILLADDVFVEGTEIVDLSLVNPSGGAQLGAFTHARLNIGDNDVTEGTVNPLDTSTFFVTQQYLDYFNREPDPGGLAHWKAKIDACGANVSCMRKAQATVNAAFFLSSEFQNGMSFSYRVQKTWSGKAPLYGELMFNNSVRRAQGNAGLVAFAVGNPEFRSTYDGLSNTAFVDRLITNSGGTFSAGQRSGWISSLEAANKTRSTVLGEIAADATVRKAVFRTAFVFMQYAGDLRRDPDTFGYNYWINRLNTFNGDYVAAGMIENFLFLSEYRNRFAP